MWVGVEEFRENNCFNGIRLTINTDDVIKVDDLIDNEISVTIYLRNCISFDITRQSYNERLRNIVEQKLLSA